MLYALEFISLFTFLFSLSKKTALHDPADTCRSFMSHELQHNQKPFSCPFHKFPNRSITFFIPIKFLFRYDVIVVSHFVSMFVFFIYYSHALHLFPNESNSCTLVKFVAAILLSQISHIFTNEKHSCILTKL